jgi:hypothetical protein
MLRCFYSCVLAAGLVSCALADTLNLKDGRAVNGTFLGGNAREIRMEVGENIQTFAIDQVESIHFRGNPTADAAPVLRDGPVLRDSTPRERPSILRPDSSSQTYSRPPAAGIEVPAGTSFVVRMIESVDSQVNRTGQTFRASLDEPVMVNGDTAIPRGADITVKLVDDKESGKISGKTVLTLDLVSVMVQNRWVDINTQAVTQASAGRGARSGKVIGGTAALGAIIGAIAGGGKGAAIGAGAGAAAGTGAEVMTKGQRVRIPSETRLTFNLEYPIKL